MIFTEGEVGVAQGGALLRSRRTISPRGDSRAASRGRSWVLKGEATTVVNGILERPLASYSSKLPPERQPSGKVQGY